MLWKKRFSARGVAQWENMLITKVWSPDLRFPGPGWSLIRYLTSVVPALLQQCGRQRQENPPRPWASKPGLCGAENIGPCPKEGGRREMTPETVPWASQVPCYAYICTYTTCTYIYTLYAYIIQDTQQHNLNIHRKSFFPRVNNEQATFILSTNYYWTPLLSSVYRTKNTSWVCLYSRYFSSSRESVTTIPAPNFQPLSDLWASHFPFILLR